MRTLFSSCRLLAAVLLMATLVSCAPTLPPAVNTDPARAQVVLPVPANASLPSLFLVGDSTVRNGRDDGQGKGADGQWGWGNPIAAHFDQAKVNVVNRAVGGLSSRTYITSGYWERTLAMVKAGDVVIIQFGHNDSSAVNDASRARGSIKGVGEETQDIDNQLTGKREVVHTYGWYLRKYISEARARGASVIVCSPIPRKAWDDAGRIRRAAGDYAGWAAQVAREQSVGFIDLNEMAARRYDGMGREAVMKLFPLVTPDERIHTNLAGAQLNAQLVVEGLKALGGHPLAAFMVDERPVVDASSVRAEAPRDPALPNLLIVGDSTVKSGGKGGAFGWGERIAPYFDTTKINVVNHAIGGRSSRTFYTEGRWDRVLAQVKAGDIVLIQFGHNDGGRIGDPAMKNRASAPGTGPETVADTRADGSKEQVHTFGWYMARYAADAKAKGATVVLVSPVPHKDKWQDGRDFASFAQWNEQVAASTGAMHMDLTLLVSDAYRAAGAATVDGFFADARTHTNDAGARFNAAQVVVGLKRLKGSPLAPYFAVPAHACEAWGVQGKRLHSDDFGGTLDQWRPEYSRAGDSTVAATGGKLLIDVGGGATVWFTHKLEGNVLMSFTRKVVMRRGKHDRLSDLNMFWMARDPANADLFTRKGEFSEYDGLELYYAGIGGNTNTTTRFRRYGNGERVLHGERTDAASMLAPNKTYAIQIAVYRGCTRVLVDGKEFFQYRDPQPLTAGYFGFRTTQSRQEIDDFTIHQLD